MSYNPGAPQPTDIPADSQGDFLDNFMLLNQFFGADHIPFGTVVSNATNANPCVCTAANHGLTTGNTVYIGHFASLIGEVIMPWSINGGPYTATVIDANTFSINVDSSTELPYLANSGAFMCTQFPYGFHKQLTFPFVLNKPPNRASPYSTLYPYLKDTVAQLAYQNNTSAIQNLTQLPIIRTTNINGLGFITPWGIRLNMGIVSPLPTGTTYDFPVPYLSTVFSMLGTGGNSSGNQRAAMNPISLTQFTAAVQPGLGTCWYFAIGV